MAKPLRRFLESLHVAFDNLQLVPDPLDHIV